MPTFSEQLDAILDNSTSGDDAYGDAMRIAAELDEARRTVSDLERQWLHAVDRLCGNLAVDVRKAAPSMNVSLNTSDPSTTDCRNGSRGPGPSVGCRLGISNNYLDFTPVQQPDSGSGNTITWVVDGGRSGGFLDDNNVDGMSATALVDAIIKFLMPPMESLCRDSGKILVNGRRATLSDLIAVANGGRR